MPVFHFHLRTAEGLERDEEGIEFQDLEAAYLDMCDGLPRMVSDLVEEGHDPGRCTFEITDAFGRMLMEVPLTERCTRGRSSQRRFRMWPSRNCRCG